MNNRFLCKNTKLFRFNAKKEHKFLKKVMFFPI
jgi:hypothetical protein